jgi:hypothetical protein
VETIRDAIACAEMTNAPPCILTLDFTEALDKIAHRYLFRLLSGYGFSTNFITLIENIYDKALSPIHINGRTTRPIPIQCSVGQGCPMSMLLFALSLNPLLIFLDQRLIGVRSGSRTRAVMATYANEITLFVTIPADIPALREAIRTYQKTTGASLTF